MYGYCLPYSDGYSDQSAVLDLLVENLSSTRSPTNGGSSHTPFRETSI